MEGHACGERAVRLFHNAWDCAKNYHDRPEYMARSETRNGFRSARGHRRERQPGISFRCAERGGSVESRSARTVRAGHFVAVERGDGHRMECIACCGSRDRTVCL